MSAYISILERLSLAPLLIFGEAISEISTGSWSSLEVGVELPPVVGAVSPLLEGTRFKFKLVLSLLAYLLLFEALALTAAAIIEVTEGIEDLPWAPTVTFLKVLPNFY